MRLTFLMLPLLAICFLASALLHGRPISSYVLPQKVPERGPARMVRFVLTNEGLYPARMQVDQGLLNLAVDDRTARSEGLLVESLQGSQRSRVAQVNRTPERSRGRALLKLPPGLYLVSDASQPGHTAELVVNP